MRSVKCSNGGFAYVALLLAIALISLAAGSALQLGALTARRDAEKQLLAIGMEFQQAFRSYAGIPAQATAAAGSRGPRTLEELLKDPRVPGIRRHLRQLYDDPLTGRSDWGLVRDAEGYILGVYSIADGRPIQTTFDPPLAHFSDAEKYSQWVFGLVTPERKPAE